MKFDTLVASDVIWCEAPSSKSQVQLDWVPTSQEATCATRDLEAKLWKLPYKWLYLLT